MVKNTKIRPSRKSFVNFVDMKDELKQTKGFLTEISDRIHYFVREHFPDDLVLVGQITAKLLLLIGILVLLDFLIKIIIKGLHTLFYRKFKENAVVNALYQSKVLNSVANFMALGITENLVASIFYRHPASYTFLTRSFSLLMIVAAYILYNRILKTIEKYYILKQDYYRITAIRAITSSLQIIGYIIFGFVGITALFGVSSSTILGTLGALTAVILLVFRDTILGFVTGIHVSTSRSVKVGDWVGIPKYNIEGTISDINLLTTKIENFDKSTSTIPTYDLMSTEVKNLQVMAEGNRRRIKRSMVFNVKSFRFVDDEFLSKLKKINLISGYIEEKKQEIENQRSALKNPDEIINGRQLTNIGVFRIYTQKYLEINPHIAQDNTLIVRQLELTPTGMPMEIYCFTTTSGWAEFENIQADIFDHLLAAAPEFGLEIMQVNKI